MNPCGVPALRLHQGRFCGALNQKFVPSSPPQPPPLPKPRQAHTLYQQLWPMADRQRTSSTAGTTSQRAAIACQSCRARKVKVCRHAFLTAVLSRKMLKGFLISATQTLLRQVKGVVHVDGLDRSACLTLCQMEGGDFVPQTRRHQRQTKYVDLLVGNSFKSSNSV
jgi:hypothetical protein